MMNMEITKYRVTKGNVATDFLTEEQAQRVSPQYEVIIDDVEELTPQEMDALMIVAEAVSLDHAKQNEDLNP